MHLGNRPNILLVTEFNLFQKVAAKVLDKEYLLLVAKTSFPIEPREPTV